MSDPNEIDRIAAEYLQAVERGEHPVPEQWIEKHPAQAKKLATFFEDVGQFGSFLGLSADAEIAETVDLRVPSNAEPANRFGDYELLGEIGRGAMGVVHRAKLKGTNLVVALKQGITSGTSAAANAKRFREEVENASGLKHPHIVPVFHVGEHDGKPYYTMALIGGGSLDKHIARFVANPRASARLMAKVARAVHYAHQRRILHRDLKPGNVILDETGEPHVGDFGLAARLDEEGEAAVGAPAGSLPWMAPEAIRGEVSVSTAIDVWALGVILYELLTARRPFEGKERNEVQAAILESEPVPPRSVNPKVPRDLDAICRRCLAKDPDNRYESASDLALDLERWLRNETVRARRSGLLKRLYNWCRRNPGIASGLGFMVLLALAGVLAAVSMARDQETRLRKEVCEGNEFAARHVASTLLNRLGQYGDAVEATADNPILQRACVDADWPTVEEILKKRLLSERVGKDAPRFATAFVLDPKGTIRAEWPQQRKVVGMNFAGRDYFQGAQARVRQAQRVHLSRVFTSKNDGLDKLAVSVPFEPATGVIWVLGATVPTDSSLGLGGLHDDHRKAVLLAPRESGGSGEYVVLVHPAYVNREPSIPFPNALQRDGKLILANDEYFDPVATQHPEYEGRWLAGFAVVPDTELVVVVQQKYDDAVAPHRAFFRRFLEWVAGAAALGAFLVVGMWWLRKH
ncbi:MAG: serine/threonine protein kinase [Gemmataceae bacterium]|nr:serine/threonine protein kinase [Gemmataceae bacterium]